MFIRGLLFLGFLTAALSPSAWAGQPALAGPHPIVVELFTSQGCSDCPAADRLVTELAKRKDVIALSLPITYWDMLGWKDTFATDANTQRQKSYARVMTHSGIYTPQMIIDGRFDVVGNQRDRVMAALAARTNDGIGETSIPIVIGTASGRLEIAIPAAKTKTKPIATIWVMRTLNQGAVNVAEGENRNRLLTYTNVVRDLQRAGEWTGDAMKIDLPLNLAKAKHDGIAVILQARDYGPVLGAALLQIPVSEPTAAAH
ncbi:MAG TPA: DUF1223 domain-containing protein [Micropepsaceae bacterium]|jgi:hypothetical protein|nr:DUF1223 domain-containing protein [Micropepsaceae bacterium]